MVHMNENNDVEIETTNDENIELEEAELVDEEEKSNDKIKKLREKLNRAEEEKKQLQDDLQRARADFLNARKRLEEERARDRIRHRKEHVEELLPLCDSFDMAMSNTEVWEKADPVWRKGIEGINNQLLRLLNSYGVKAIEPKGEPFDPHRDEAVGTEVVEDEKLVDTVVSVLQRGYEIQVGDATEVIRHARVTTGTLKD
jgi:molecular chaperone GrpE